MGQIIVFILALVIWIISLVVKASKKKRIIQVSHTDESEFSTASAWEEEENNNEPEQAFWEKVRAERISNSKHKIEATNEAELNPTSSKTSTSVNDFAFNLKDAVLYSEIMNPKFKDNDNI